MSGSELGALRQLSREHGKRLAVNDIQDEVLGDSFEQGSGGVDLVDSGAAVPHLPLWRRDLLPGHGGQHRATCPGGALHQGSAAEVSLSKHEGDVFN